MESIEQIHPKDMNRKGRRQYLKKYRQWYTGTQDSHLPSKKVIYTEYKKKSISGVEYINYKKSLQTI